MADRRQPRLKEIASEVGLSIAAVSRALGGHSDIAPDTRTRVQEVANRLGYIPSRAARMLVSGRTDFIGMVMPVREQPMLDASLSEFVAGLGEGLADRGRDLFIATVTPRQSDLEVLKHIVDGDRADAVVINRTLHDDPRIAYLLDRRFPFVAHGRAEGESRPFAWVDTDSEAGFTEAVDLLFSLGHRSFGLLTSAKHFNFSTIRRRAMEAALARHGLTLDAIAETPLGDNPAAETAALHLLTRPDRPTAILCVTDALALSVLEVARKTGLSVPDDLSVIGFNNIPVAAYSSPPLSTFDQSVRKAAAAVAAMTIDLLEDREPKTRNQLLPVRFIPRASHGPAPAAPLRPPTVK